WEWHYLKRLGVGGIPPLRHAAAVLSVAFSPDGRWIASGCQDGVVKVWDALTGQEWFSLKAHDGNVYGVAFSSGSPRTRAKRLGGSQSMAPSRSLLCLMPAATPRASP